MEQRLTYITLGVNDLPLMRDFYKNVFGWEPMDANENVVFFRLNGIVLGLFGNTALAEDAGVPATGLPATGASAEGEGFKGFSLSHNLRSEEEVDALFSALEEKGVKVVKRPEKVFWGGYSSYVADPEGNLWEIAYNPYLKMDSEGNVAP